MNKEVKIGLSVVALAGIVYFGIIPHIQPRFAILSADNIEKEGVFTFGGKRNSFSMNKGGTAIARNGYSVVYGQSKGNYSFDLYRNGVFVKNLKTIW
jgi:hypothetical protein